MTDPAPEKRRQTALLPSLIFGIHVGLCIEAMFDPGKNLMPFLVGLNVWAAAWYVVSKLPRSG